MYALDHDTLEAEYEEPLVDIMCALGARQLASDNPRDYSEGFDSVEKAFSERAHTKVMARLHDPTAQQLMTMVLLCEYAARTNKHAMAFVLAGCVFRQLCLLGIDKPVNNAERRNVIPAECEAENRLVWACYSLDVSLASGVDKNSSWRERYPHVPLPCSDSEFLAQSPSRPRTLDQVLTNPTLTSELDLPALNSVLTHLRTKVLRYDGALLYQ
jgi:hypothetical protein